VLSGSGGECTLVADAATQVGLEVPELSESAKTQLNDVLPDFGNLNNPLDGTGAMYDDEKIFPRLLQALIDDTRIDVVTVNLEANDPRPRELKSGNRFAQAIEKAATGATKPVAIFSSVVGGPVDPDILAPLRAAGVPLMEGAECAMAALRNLGAYYEFRQLGGATEVRRPLDLEIRSLPSGILPTASAFRLLESFGIPTVPTALAQTAEEAAGVAGRIGFPVALKIECADITHKSDVGGVLLNLASATEVRETFTRMREQASKHVPPLDMAGVVVQRMASQGTEMIIGIKQDLLFGPVVICGFGGIFVELLKDVAIGIPPLSREQALALVQRLRGWPLLRGARGRPPADVEALCDAVVAVSQLAVSLGEQLVALDINPLIVQPDKKGVVAVDALVQIR
jgi:acyl-CoA synthetase (NDP forming)